MIIEDINDRVHTMSIIINFGNIEIIDWNEIKIVSRWGVSFIISVGDWYELRNIAHTRSIARGSDIKSLELLVKLIGHMDKKP